MTAKVWVRASIAAALLAVAASVAAAQQSVSTSDIQRLQDQVYQAGSDVSRLRSTDSDAGVAAGDGARRSARRGRVPEGQAAQGGHRQPQRVRGLRDRLQTLRSRARGETHHAGRRQSASRRSPAGVGTATARRERRRHRPRRRRATQPEHDSRRPGNRRAAADRADLRHRAGRGSLRGHDRRRSLPTATTC